MDPNNSKAYYLLGQNLFSAGRDDEAIAAWKHAAQLAPNDTEVLYKRSQVLRKRDPSEAKVYLSLLKTRLSEQQATNQADTTGNLALAAANNHDYSTAIAELQSAVVVCGQCRDKATLKKDLGIIEARAGSIAAAAHELKEAASLNPSDPAIKQALAWVLQQQSALH